MRIIGILLFFVYFQAKGQIIQECDFDRMNIRFEISNIISDDFYHKYSFDYTFRIENYDSLPKYIAVEDLLHDTIILSAFSGRYGLNRILKFYFGTCNESRLPESCHLPDQSLVLRKVRYGEVLSTVKTVNTVKDIIDALRKPEVDIVLAYFNANLFGGTNTKSERVTKKLYWDSQHDRQQLYLKTNVQNFKELQGNGTE